MTSTATMRARPNRTSTVTLLGAEAVRITNDLASRPYYYDKGPALFR